MKKLILIFTIVVSIISCNGQQNTGFFGSYQGDVITKPIVWTSAPTSITTNSAVLGGYVEHDGNLPIIRNGVCWNTTGVMDVLGADYYNMPVCHVTTGINCYFSMNVPFFSPNTKYYIQAYAENDYGINFSSQGTFTTLSATSIPAVSTNLITSITSTTATSGGEVINQGSSSVTDRGICWSTSFNPTTSQPSTPTTSGGKTSNGSGLGEFTSSIINAAGNTLYHVRAYATNSVGTAYGTNQTFTTLGVLPTVETATTSLITLNSATSGGIVTNQGTSTVTQRGICYSTSINPNTSQPTVTTPTGGKIISGSGLGSFTCNLTGLNSGVIYYVRAYAINSSGTSYGVNQSFTTTQQTMATLSSSLFAETSTTLVVRWTLTLSQPTTTNVIIPIIRTNGDNTGTETSGFVLSGGQITATENTVYSKQSSSYTAYANFGTMPYGFTGTNSESYAIPAFTCLSIGASYQGGVVAYLFQSGDAGYVSGECHGIITSSTHIGFYKYYDGTLDWFDCGATETAIGSGQRNTNKIIDPTYGYSTYGYAATACNNYSNGGYSDWFLPSSGEAQKIYNSRALLGGDTLYPIWTSTETETQGAYTLDVIPVNTNKISNLMVRPIRYF